MKEVLFICLGNICRSPSAEAVFRALIDKAGLANEISCDSAGMISYHAGEVADSRMQRHAIRRGYDLTSISRPFKAGSDFERFDYIVAMDHENRRDLVSHDPAGKYRDKIVMMTDYCRVHDDDVVPDPYYGGDAGFERVLDLLEDACAGLLAHMSGK